MVGTSVSPGHSDRGRWDYASKPVIAADPDQPIRWDTHFTVSAALAFDGFGGRDHPRSVARGWQREGVPSPGSPFTVVVDYGMPVAVSSFEHYFFEPGVPDFQHAYPWQRTAFEAVRVSRGHDGVKWEHIEEHHGLERVRPQRITLDRALSYRFYRLEVLSLDAGAAGLRTYEIETHVGPALRTPETTSMVVKTPTSLEGAVTASESGCTVEVTGRGLETAPEPAAVDSNGRYRVGVVARRPGRLAVTITLRDGGGAMLDQRKHSLHVLSRVSVHTADHQGQPMHLLTNTSDDVVLRLRATGVRKSDIHLEPGETFFLPASADGQGRVQEVAVEEEGCDPATWLQWVPGAPTSAPTDMKQGSAHADEDGLLLQAGDPRLGRYEAPVRLAALDGASRLRLEIVSQDEERLHAVALVDEGVLDLVLEADRLGGRLSCRYRPLGIQSDDRSCAKEITVQLTVMDVHMRFIPAYCYSYEPSFVRRVSGSLPTRMAAVETPLGTLALVPDRDGTYLAIEGDHLSCEMLVTGLENEVRIVTVSGTWRDSYRTVVSEVFRFEEPLQYRPLVQDVLSEGAYLAHHSDAWNEEMGAVTNFPGSSSVYVYYGAPYTLPALYGYYLATGDHAAQTRAHRHVQWMLTSPVRIRDGFFAGAFWSEYQDPDAPGSPGIETWQDTTVTGGRDQAMNRWVAPHASGSAAWALVTYYLMDGERDAEALAAARNAADFLLRVQRPDGGWSYAFDLEGNAVTEEGGAGNIWSIWALHRLGTLTGDGRYIEGARLGAAWFRQEFVARHLGRGFWEDMSGMDGSVRLTEESYELFLATLAYVEMGDSITAVECFDSASTWVWTRVPDYRDYWTSYGQVHEQSDWPPGSYIAPLAGLAAQCAFAASNDDFYIPYIGSAKTIGRLVDTEVGTAYIPYEATRLVPVDPPFAPSFWIDWITAQQSSMCLQWLIGEVNRHCAGSVHLDPLMLVGRGSADGAVLDLRDLPLHAGDGEQVDWLGLRTGEGLIVVVLNRAEATTVQVDSAPSRIRSRALGQDAESAWEAGDVSARQAVPALSISLLEWDVDPRPAPVLVD